MSLEWGNVSDKERGLVWTGGMVWTWRDRMDFGLGYSFRLGDGFGLAKGLDWRWFRTREGFRLGMVLDWGTVWTVGWFQTWGWI